jgi:hypothetical protein
MVKNIIINIYLIIKLFINLFFILYKNIGANLLEDINYIILYNQLIIGDFFLYFNIPIFYIDDIKNINLFFFNTIQKFLIFKDTYFYSYGRYSLYKFDIQLNDSLPVDFFDNTYKDFKKTYNKLSVELNKVQLVDRSNIYIKRYHAEGLKLDLG